MAKPDNTIRGPRAKRTRAYRSWLGMRSRCRNPSNKNFHRYGGRGITICQEWDALEKFCADMGDPPPRTSLDRIDNNGNYDAKNCRWATPLQQSQNTASVKNLTFNGETMCIRAWARLIEISDGTIRDRLAKGWPTADVLSTAWDVPPESAIDLNSAREWAQGR